MADITRRRQGEILQAVFDTLTDQSDGVQAKDVIQEVEKRLVPTDFERADYSERPGVRRFDKIVRFSTIPAVKAGWLVKNKGTWILTDDGKAARQEFSAPEDLMRESVRLYSVWRKAQPSEEDLGGEDEGAIEADVAVASITLEEAEETARQEIRGYLSKMPPYDFQELVATLLRAMNYHVAWVAPPGPDRGLDILAYTDPLGATGPRIKVQVKRRADKIAVQEARSFMAILSATDVGIFISTGGFTPDAHSEARHQENRRVTLIGLDELIDLWVENYNRIPEAERQRLPLKPIFYLAP